MECPSGKIYNPKKKKCVKDGKVAREVIRIDALTRQVNANNATKKKTSQTVYYTVESKSPTVFYSASSSPTSSPSPKKKSTTKKYIN